MIMLAHIDGNRRILLVMALHVELLLLGELTGVDGGRDIGSPIAQHGQGAGIDVVIYKYNGAMCLFDKAHYLYVGIKYLPIVENAFYWRQVLLLLSAYHGHILQLRPLRRFRQIIINRG